MGRVVAILLLMLLLSWLPPINAVAATSPAAFNIRVTDVPSGTLKSDDKTDTPATLAASDPKTAAMYKKEGVVIANTRSFLALDASFLLSALYLFVSPAKAHVAFTTLRRYYVGAMVHGDRIVATRGLGNESADFVGFLSTAYPGSVVVFRRGPYVDFMLLGDKTATRTYPASLALKLARLVDSCIQQH
jgi:hypothetical protein